VSNGRRRVSTEKKAVRLPLNTFAIGLGIAGIAEAWTAAEPVLEFPRYVGAAVWVVAAIAWVWLIAAHLARGRKSDE